MPSIFVSKTIANPAVFAPSFCYRRPFCPSPYPEFPFRPNNVKSRGRRRSGALVFSKPSSSELSAADEEWLRKLPERKKPLYSHSLPCIEAWLRSLGFHQSREDRDLWLAEKPDWHAHVALDVTDLYIRYLKSGPGNLEKDVERRFSYALSREDIENAILGGP